MIKPNWNFAILMILLVLSSHIALASEPEDQQSGIVIQSPRGGEVYSPGQPQAVILGGKPPSKAFLVELSRDGGETYEPLGEMDLRNLSRNQLPILKWQVAGPACNNALIRVTSTDPKKPASQVSNTFSIAIVSADEEPLDAKKYVDEESSKTKKYVDDKDSKTKKYIDDGNESAKRYVDDNLSAKVARAGDKMTGHLVLNAAPNEPMHAATKQYVDDESSRTKQYVDEQSSKNAADASDRVARAGDKMTGDLTLGAHPSAPMHAATKQYVDGVAGAAGTDRVAKAGDVMTGGLILPPDGLTIGGNQVVASNGNVGIGTAAASNKLCVKSCIGSFNEEAQHKLQLQIESGTGVNGARAMGMGVLDNGDGMIQVKELNVGYHDLSLQPLAASVGIGMGGASPGASLHVNNNGFLGTTSIAKFSYGYSMTPVARIDNSGKGFFNGGTQMGGADLAEAFAVDGDPASYHPGDVLEVSAIVDRQVRMSQEPYSTRIVGVYATKPGVILTERGMDASMADLVPLGVVGVIPTKVCGENGPIKRGDLLVSSSKPGHAMRGTDRQRMLGAVVGKALENFDGDGRKRSYSGVIKVLVNVK